MIPVPASLMKWCWTMIRHFQPRPGRLRKRAELALRRKRLSGVARPSSRLVRTWREWKVTGCKTAAKLLRTTIIPPTVRDNERDCRGRIILLDSFLFISYLSIIVSCLWTFLTHCI
ncbi:hypothetical protein DFS34DRAFT_687797 [Phlyctochytrium arcticum]|nr:hypothetical protein DFS34DRAFT_687797 [Phlyctochytrium arcticum]